MTRRERSLLAAGIALLAAGLFVASAVYLAETITGPPTVRLDYTTDTLPRTAP